MFWDKWKYELFDKDTLIDKIIEDYKGREGLKESKNHKINFVGIIYYLFFSMCLIGSTFNFILRIINYLKNEKYLSNQTLENNIILISYLLCSLGLFYVIIKVLFMQFQNEDKIRIFNYKYCEIFFKGVGIFGEILESEEFKKKFVQNIILVISMILFYYPVLNLTLNKKFDFIQLIYIIPLALVVISEKYKDLQLNRNKIIKWVAPILINRNKIVKWSTPIFIIGILYYHFYNNLEIIGFLMSDKIFIVGWVMGILLLEMLNKKEADNVRCIGLCMYNILAIILFILGVLSFFLMFIDKQKIIYPLSTIIIFILVLLIEHKFVINLKVYKNKKKEIYNEKIELIKSVLKENNIKEDKYEEVLKRSIDKSEEYYNLENKFNLVAKSLLLWGGISIIVEKIKNMKLEMIKNLIQDINENGIMKVFYKIITKYEYLIVLLTYIIFFVIFLWVLWVILFFVFEKVVEIKYISKRELFEFRDLLQDIIIMEDKDGK